MGEALFRRGEQEKASEYLLRALATLGSPLPASGVARRRAILLKSARQLGHRLLSRFLPRTLTPDTIRALEERCRVYNALVWTNMFADITIWLLGLLLLLNEGERAGIDWAASAGASGMAMVAHTLSFQWPFRVYISSARTLAEHSGQNPQLAQTELVTGMWAYWIEADFEAALASLRRAAELYRDLGDARRWATAMGVATYVPSERGDLAGGLDTSREMAQLGVETGDRLTQVWGEAWEAELLYLAGEISVGEEAMRRTVDDMLAMMDYRIGGKVAGRLAACYLAQGKLDEAQTLLAEHRELLRKNGIRGGNASSVILNSAAAALVAVERTDRAAPAARLAEARRACRAALKQVRLDRTASVPAYRAKVRTSGSAGARVEPIRGGRRASITPRGSAAATRGRSPRWRWASARATAVSCSAPRPNSPRWARDSSSPRRRICFGTGPPRSPVARLPDLLRRRPICIALFARSG